MRQFNGKPIELLAPAGNFEIFKALLDTKCDAIYFGGKTLNMRVIRKGYNFSNDEIKEAIKLAKEKDKKVYITLNSLINESEIEEAKEYLIYLNEVKPDGLIVQDLAIVKLIKELELELEVHSSVMMNVHNLDTIKVLKDLGVSRVVLSREMTLDQAKYMHSKLKDVELEYFTHGDMCSVHGAQCIYSSMIFGMSSNRGRCLKPCRWAYKIKYGEQMLEEAFPLAVKDMCMYQYLPEMIEAGITSFKIEGRMRDKEFITRLIDIYGDALDRYIEDPLGFDRNKDYKELFDNRKRDLSTGYAFGNPGLEYMNTRWEGTGKFYSTGKMFSTPTEEAIITKEKVEKIKSTSQKDRKNNNKTLSVKVNSIEQAKIAIDNGVNRIYLSGDVYQPNKPFSLEEIKSLYEIKGDVEVFLGLPRMMTEQHFNEYEQFLRNNYKFIDGLLITNIGAVGRFKDIGLPMVGDTCLNIYNHKAYEFYKEIGLSSMAPSIELPYDNLIDLLENTTDMELVVQGHLTSMYLEHDLYKNIPTEIMKEGKQIHLVTDKSQLPVYKDQHGRCHILMEKEYCLLPLLDVLGNVAGYRIEASTYSKEKFAEVITLYKEAIKNGVNEDNLNALYSEQNKYTLGNLGF